MMKKTTLIVSVLSVTAVLVVCCVALRNYSVRTERLKNDLASKEELLHTQSAYRDQTAIEAEAAKAALELKARCLAVDLAEKDRQIAELKREVSRRTFIARKLDVTAYNPTADQCDDDPSITASSRKARPGIVAVSQDLFDQGWSFGRQVYIEGHGVFTIDDKMNSRVRNRMDVFMHSSKSAKEFGVKNLRVVLLPEMHGTTSVAGGRDARLTALSGRS